MRTIINRMPNRRNFLRGKYTVEIGYPWLSYGAIMAIEEKLKPTDNMLELGSGGSTIFFSRRCNSVKSYDPESVWVEKVKAALSKPSNVTFVCGDGSVLIETVKKEPNEYYDWLLVDISNSQRFRLKMIREATPKLKKGGFMIVDNYDKRFINRFDYTGWDVYTFDDFDYAGRGTRICIKQ